MSPARILGRPAESSCEWCPALEGEPCEGECGCPDCENERALDEDADAYAERLED